MDRWLDKQTDSQLGRVDGQNDGVTFGWMDWRSDGWTDEPDRWIDGRNDGLIDRLMVRRMDWQSARMDWWSARTDEWAQLDDRLFLVRLTCLVHWLVPQWQFVNGLHCMLYVIYMILMWCTTSFILHKFAI